MRGFPGCRGCRRSARGCPRRRARGGLHGSHAPHRGSRDSHGPRHGSHGSRGRDDHGGRAHGGGDAPRCHRRRAARCSGRSRRRSCRAPGWARCRAAARASRSLGRRVGGRSLLNRLFGGRLLSLVSLLLGRGSGFLAGSLFLRGRGAGAVAQQLDQLGLTKLGDALEAAGGGQSLQLRQLHRRQRRGRLGGGFVAHEVILTGMRPQRAR